MSESEGTVTVTVEILEGTVADENVTLQFSTQDNTALSMFYVCVFNALALLSKILYIRSIEHKKNGSLIEGNNKNNVCLPYHYFHDFRWF